MSSPTYYARQQSNRLWSVVCSRRGEILEDIDCIGSAQAHIAELEAEDRAAEAEALADAQHDAIGDFLHAVDRGDFGDALKVGPASNRAESAFVAGLRTAYAARAALSDRSLTATAHDRGVSLVALTAEAA